MIILPLAIIFILLAFYHSKFIRKHNLKLYIIFSIVAIIAFLLRDKFPLADPFIQGAIGLGFLYVVMFTGALKKKSKLHIKLMSVRREYSIIGFIALTPHALYNTIAFLQGELIGLEWVGLIPYAIMIPLFITSFMIVRKKFTFTTWKKIQNYAYIVYILIFLHLLIVYTNKVNLIVFIILFSVYFILKIKKELTIYLDNKKELN